MPYMVFFNAENAEKAQSTTEKTLRNIVPNFVKLCATKKRDQKVTRRISQSSTKKTLRNLFCLDFHNKAITF